MLEETYLTKPRHSPHRWRQILESGSRQLVRQGDHPRELFGDVGKTRDCKDGFAPLFCFYFVILKPLRLTANIAEDGVCGECHKGDAKLDNISINMAFV